MKRLASRLRLKSLPLKTYPVDPDALCETTLTPPEGYWSQLEQGNVELFAFAKVGSKSVRSWLTQQYYYMHVYFNLNSPYDGTRNQSKLNAWIFIQSGSFRNELEITLDDAYGRYVVKDLIGVPLGQFFQISLAIGPGTGWSGAVDFDWSAIQVIGIRFSGPGAGSVYIDELHFSYYEVIRPTLAIDSVPQGKSYTLDGVSGATPSPPYGLDPDVDYSVYMDPVDFDRWEDGLTSNPRTIRLAEGENKVITAYYVTAPPPGKGTLYCHAFANSEEVAASVEVVGVETYNTPFSLNLNPATYTLKASYKGQAKQTVATVSEGKITEVDFSFVKAGPPGIDWMPLIVVGGLFGAVIVISQI